MSEVLDLATAIDLGHMIDWAIANQVVTWIDERGEAQAGTVRHFVRSADDYGFLGRYDDVREGHLRITTKTGFEWAPSVKDVLDRMNKNEFVKGDFT